MQTAHPVDFYSLRPTGGGTDQRLVVDGTTGGVQLTAYADTVTHCLITVETAEMRFTLDGSAPTATNGHVLAPYDVLIWPASWVTAAKFIRVGAASGALHCSPLTKAGA